MKWIIYIGMICCLGLILSGCQHQRTDIHKIVFGDPVHPPNSKTWDKTLLPPSSNSVNEEKVAALNKTN